MRRHVNPNDRRGLSRFATGLIALVLIVIGSYLAFAGGLPFGGGYELRAVVSAAPGIGSRTPVRIAGVQVGEVRRVERGPGDAATVTFSVRDAGRPIRSDATVKIRPRIFLEGNFFLDLRPGTPGARELASGATIPLSQTAVPVQLDQVLSSLQSSTRQNLRTLVREYGRAVDGGGARSLNRSLPSWAPAFRSVARVAEAVRGRRPDDLRAFLRDGGRTAAAIARNRAALARLVPALNRTARGLALDRARLEASVSGLDALTAQAGPALAAVNRLLPSVRAFVADVRPGLRAAPATLALANPLLAQVGALVAPPELPALLAQARPAIASLARLEPPLGRLLGLVTPVTECLRVNALPTLKKPVSDPPLTTGVPVYQELLHGLVGLASASQNFDANGPAVRYHAGFGDQLVTSGRVPGLQEPLKALTSEPIIGSRPRYTGKQPPFRPDVPCASQRPPDLRAETGPAPQQASVAVKAPAFGALRGLLDRKAGAR